MSESIQIQASVQGSHTQEHLHLIRDTRTQSVNVCISRPGANTNIIVSATSLLLAAQSVTSDPQND